MNDHIAATRGGRRPAARAALIGATRRPRQRFCTAKARPAATIWPNVDSGATESDKIVRFQIEERHVQIVGFERTDRDANAVETIDVWFSARRKTWLVERLDAEGHQIGLTHRCVSEEDAMSCLAEWLRTHSDTRLVAPRETTAAERELLERSPHRRAA